VQFNNNNFDIEDAERSGRPSFNLQEAIQAEIDVNKHSTTRTIGLALNCSHETIWRNLLNMGKRYLANSWIPHELTVQNKEKRFAICSELLTMMKRNNFLYQLITGDEIWIYWDNEGTGTQHRSWRGAGDQPIATPRQTLTTRKHLASIFWDSKGVLLVDVLPRGETITADYYCGVLDRLKAAIIDKRRRLISAGFNNIHFLHDNARPHTAKKTAEKLKELSFTVLPHPPYSPDLAPSDYYLFSSLKSALRGKKYNNQEEVGADIEAWIASKQPSFYATGINKLPGRWQKCIDHNGSYFEHLNENDE
jgi:histone-lysine N-methyltransferase SETMAR